MKILVMDGHTRTALAAVRSVAALGQVHVVSPRRRSIAGASRSVAAVHTLPEPANRASAFLGELAELVRSERLDVILPVTDASSRLVLPARSRFEQATVAGPSAQAFAALTNKARVAELAARAGIAVPAWELATDASSAARAAGRIGFPLVLKPIESVRLDENGHMQSGQVARVDRVADLEAAWPRAVGGGAALVQQFVGGWGEGLFILRWDGATRAVFAHRRLREKPPGGGVSTLSESTAPDPDEVARVERVLDEVGFQGAAMAEFRTDGSSRWLMEFNARLWGSVQLAIDAGVDFPRLLVEAALGRPAPKPCPYPVGIRSRWLLGDIDRALLLARGRRGPRGESGLRAAISALAARNGPHCRLQVLRADDPAPFCAELCEWLRALAF